MMIKPNVKHLFVKVFEVNIHEKSTRITIYITILPENKNQIPNLFSLDPNASRSELDVLFCCSFLPYLRSIFFSFSTKSLNEFFCFCLSYEFIYVYTHTHTPDCIIHFFRHLLSIQLQSSLCKVLIAFRYLILTVFFLSNENRFRLKSFVYLCIFFYFRFLVGYNPINGESYNAAPPKANEPEKQQETPAIETPSTESVPAENSTNNESTPATETENTQPPAPVAENGKTQAVETTNGNGQKQEPVQKVGKTLYSSSLKRFPDRVRIKAKE